MQIMINDEYHIEIYCLIYFKFRKWFAWPEEEV